MLFQKLTTTNIFILCNVCMKLFLPFLKNINKTKKESTKNKRKKKMLTFNENR